MEVYIIILREMQTNKKKTIQKIIKFYSRGYKAKSAAPKQKVVVFNVDQKNLRSSSNIPLLKSV